VADRQLSQTASAVSARTTEQLEQILPAATVALTPAEVDRLSATTSAA
jgi:aryl-alcohol dehydrogenase-like predicted oxidoreductase